MVWVVEGTSSAATARLAAEIARHTPEGVRPRWVDVAGPGWVLTGTLWRPLGGIGVVSRVRLSADVIAVTTWQEGRATVVVLQADEDQGDIDPPAPGRLCA